MHLPENLRERLKTPLGTLLKDIETTKENILKEIPKDSFIITVGDATTEKMLNFEIIPSLQIVDEQEKRIERQAPSTTTVKTSLTCNNPAGEITQDSIDKIKSSFKLPTPVRITVNGEEDLLVIPVCLHAPNNAVVLYGQPNEGLVIVQVNDEIRNKVQVILNNMN